MISSDVRPDAICPALGEEKMVALSEYALVLRHGTSLRLMASCSAFLNKSQEFNNVDPEEDWNKWTSRVSDAFTLYYSAIVDPTDPSPSGIHCVLRAVLDGWPTPTPPHNRRLIIDYVASRAESRRLGLASTLVQFAREFASKMDANLYVLAIEDSCAWWIDKGFILEENANLNARLKVFPDVHLLSKKGDRPDAGSADDLSFAEGDEEEESEEEHGEENGDGDDEDYSLQLALQLSATNHERDDDDPALKKAIALSLGWS